MVFLQVDQCKASCGNYKGYKDECILNDPQFEACMNIVNLEQAFEAKLQMMLNIDEARQCSLARVSGEEINRDD